MIYLITAFNYSLHTILSLTVIPYSARVALYKCHSGGWTIRYYYDMGQTVACVVEDHYRSVSDTRRCKLDPIVEFHYDWVLLHYFIKYLFDA